MNFPAIFSDYYNDLAELKQKYPEDKTVQRMLYKYAQIRYMMVKDHLYKIYPKEQQQNQTFLSNVSTIEGIITQFETRLENL